MSHKKNGRVLPKNSINGDPKAQQGHGVLVRIAQPFTIQNESTAEENRQYEEEKAHRKSSLLAAEKQVAAARKQNAITVVNIFLTIFSLLVLGASIFQSRQALRVDQRAWIGESQIRWKGKPGEVSVPLIQFVVKNTGKTPALDVVSMSKLIVAIAGDPEPEFEPTKLQRTFSGMVAPGGEIFTSLPLKQAATQSNPSGGLDPQSITALQTEFFRPYVYSRIEYKDVFGEAHWTEICYRLMANAEAHSCAKHNDADH